MYQQHKIKIKFTLKKGEKDEEIITFNDCQAAINVGAYSGASGTMASGVIFGLSEIHIAKLTSTAVNIWTNAGVNNIEISYDDDVVFRGGIYLVYADYNQAPNVAINFTASGPAAEKMTPIKPFAYNGLISLEQALKTIAATINYKVVNYGVNKTLKNPHYVGDPITQIQDMLSDLDVSYNLTYQSVEIFEKSINDVELKIGPQNGLQGYPIFREGGIQVTTDFSQLIKPGRNFNLTTTLPNGSGKYRISTVSSTITSRIPGANSITQIIGNKTQ